MRREVGRDRVQGLAPEHRAGQRGIFRARHRIAGHHRGVQRAGARGPAIAARWQGRAQFRHRLRARLFGGRKRPVDRFQQRHAVAGQVAGLRGRHQWVSARPCRRFDRLVSGHRPVEHRADRIDVGPRTLAPVRVILLQRRIAGGDDRGQFGVRCRGAGRPEVEQHGAAVLANVDVAGLDVTVQVAAAMHHLEAVEQRARDREQRRFRQRAAGRDPLVERLAVDELHDHVGGLVGLEKAHHPNDVGVLERGQGPRFVDESRATPIEAFEGRRRFHGDRMVRAAQRELGRQVFLDRDFQRQVAVGRQVSQAEAANPKGGLDAVFVECETARKVDTGLGHGYFSSIRLIAFSRLRRMRLNDLASNATSSLPVSASSGVSI